MKTKWPRMNADKRGSQRVVRTKTSESENIVVGGINFGSMLNRNGGDVGIGGQIAAGSYSFQKVSEQLKVAWSRLDDRACKQIVKLGRLRFRLGLKGVQASVRGRIAIYSVNQEVYVRYDHRSSASLSFRARSSSSISSDRASAFVRSTRSRPSEYVRWTNRGLAAPSLRVSPARTASLSTRSNSRFRSRTSRRSSSSTSGSSFTTVSIYRAYQGRV